MYTFAIVGKIENEYSKRAVDRLIEKLELLRADSAERGGIILGEVEDGICQGAMELLGESLSGKSSGQVGYAVVACEGNIYAVWSDFHMAEAAVDAILEDFEGIKDGYSRTECFNLMDYLTMRVKRITDAAWDRLREAIGDEFGDEITLALRELYSLFPESIVKWLANLYDPESGGWYWSNSARDCVGYRASLEETYEALSFISSSGMAEGFGGDYAKAIPCFMKEKIIEYFTGMQDEDGFFYLPQWPKKFIEKNGLQSRITRDIGSAFTVLTKLGAKPKYPRGGIASAKEENQPKKKMLSQFDSKEAFSEYVRGIEREYLAESTPDGRAFKFYYYGNQLQSTTSYINAKPELKPILFDLLDKYQNETTGMWSEIPCFNATNGLHKIASVANSIGYRMKHIDRMVDTVMDIIASTPEENPAKSCVNIYNAWSCLPYIYSNILQFGEGSEKERQTKKDAIKSRVMRTAAQTIRTCCRQMLAFKRDDGAYSYGLDGSIPKAQGVPIAVYEKRPESDVNGNSISVIALKLHIFRALELEEFSVPLFTERERMIFMGEIESVIRNGAPKKEKLPLTVVVNEWDRLTVEENLNSFEKIHGDISVTDTVCDNGTRQLIIGDFNEVYAKKNKEQLLSALDGKGDSVMGFAIFSSGCTFRLYSSDVRILPLALKHYCETFPASDGVWLYSFNEATGEFVEIWD